MMAQTEDEVKDSHVSYSPAKVVGMWQKFHFSGRVIMCSVLFGLGLILIGGLIFAINVDDDTNQELKNKDTAVDLPTKAPSNYVGPVVMGIGSFIVIVGVIMCMFETQICRKKTADSKPLISDKNEDVQVKVSDSSPITSASHCHKNHKHKNRKASPRKTKNKLAKSQEQKQSSSKSPPITIDKAKNFMTSSEENFLTPPNTLSEHTVLVHKNSKEVEIQTSSSLMKSFTSSGTWGQSSEFLTPTASYKENSVSVDNSVELDEKQGQINSKQNEVPAINYTSPEYMTPLPAAEERIQEMFIQVQNEHQKLDNLEEKETPVNLNSEPENDSNIKCEVNFKSEISANSENIKDSINAQNLDINFDISVVKEIPDKPVEVLPTFKENENVNEENVLSDNITSSSIISSEKNTVDKDENGCESADITIDAYENIKENDSPKNNASSLDYINEKPDSILSDVPTTSHLNETENNPEQSNEKANESNLKLDLESSASSEETLVSHDNSVENPKVIEAQTVLSTTEEISGHKSETSDASESPITGQLPVSRSMSDTRNSFTDMLNSVTVGASDLNSKEMELKETEDINEKVTEKSS